MKKLIIFLFVFVFTTTYAQSPQGINYQSIIRNSAGTMLPSTAVLVEFKLYNGLAGPLVYFEKHNTTTNPFGMANLIIGQGTPITGTFNTINWVNGIAYEVYVNSNLVGTKQLFMSVPYALFSSTQPLNLSGTVLSSGPSSNSVTLNTGTTYTNGAGISIASGTIISNTSPNQTVTLVPGNTNISVGGSYPNYLVSSTSTLSLAGTTLSISNGNTVVLPNPGASTTLTPASFPNNNVLITGTTPSYTVGAPSYSITNPLGNTLVINNGLNSSTLNFNPILSGDAIGSINSSTVVSIQGEQISPINPSPGQVLQYIGSVWTPTTLSPPPSPTLNLISNILSVGSSTINLANATNGFWSTKGNLGTTPVSNFIGTSDAADLVFRTSNSNRMVISSTGSVNINSDVSIPAINSYSYATAKTRYLSIPSAAFSPENSNAFVGRFITGQMYAQPITGTLTLVTGFSTPFYAGINLPDGAIITQVDGFVVDNSAATNISNIQLFSHTSPIGSAFGVQGLNSSVASVGVNPNIQKLTIPALGVVINNFTSSYFIRYQGVYGGLGNEQDIKLARVLITYTIDKVD